MRAVRAGGGEAILDFPPRLAPIRHMRSTVILGAMAAVKDAGHFEKWRDAIPQEPRDMFLQMVAGVWIPIETAMVHYRACDALQLPPEAEVRLGAAVFERINGTIFATASRLANEAGVTPWAVLQRLQRFWDRAFDGGGVQVVRVGPKEAHAELIQCAVADSHFFRNALRGNVTAMLQLFSRKAYVHERAHAPGTLSLRMQWA